MIKLIRSRDLSDFQTNWLIDQYSRDTHTLPEISKLFYFRFGVKINPNHVDYILRKYKIPKRPMELIYQIRRSYVERKRHRIKMQQLYNY